MSEWSNMSTCGLVQSQDNVSEWSNMSTCGLVQSQDNVSEWSNMSTFGLLLHLTSTINIQLSVFV